MNARTKIVLRCGIIVLMACGLLMGPPAFPQIDDSSPPWVVSTDNDYIGLAIGWAGKWKVPDNESHNIIPEQPVGGRFQIWTTGGDPTTLLDDNLKLIYSDYAPPYPGDKWGAFQLMVDAASTAEGADPSQRAWCVFERGGTSAMLGDMVDGFWTVPPYVPTNTANTIIGTWYPRISKGDIPTATAVDVIAFPLRCDLEARVMRDTVRFKWTFTNEDFMAHSVGLRMYGDVKANPVDDGTVDYRNIVSIPGRPLILNATLVQGKEVPSLLEMFNSQQDPVVSLRFTLKGQGATTPDVLGVDDWWIVSWSAWSYWFGIPPVGGDPYMVWSYQPTPNMPIYDLAAGVFWKPRRLTPGSRTTFITYLGLACATSDFTKPNMDNPLYVAATQSPRALKYTNDADGVGQLYPQPFKIYAYMTNLTGGYLPMDFQDASFTLTLPPALTLDASEGGKYTKSVAKIGAGAETGVSWKVNAAGYPTGIQEYTVSFSATPVGGTTVRRQINIPATENQPLSTGWQMISVPFSVTNPDPTTALGLSGSGAVFWRYDTYSRQYKSVTKLIPGEAYWLHLNSTSRASLTPGEFAPLTWAGTQGYQIPLLVGWNLVGNPFVYTITLGETKFYHRDYGPMTYDQAVSRGLLTTTVFWWDAVFRQYRWSSDRAVQIKPWQGYWVRALRAGLTAIMTPESQIGAAVGGSPTPDDGSGGSGGGPPGGP